MTICSAAVPVILSFFFFASARFSIENHVESLDDGRAHSDYQNDILQKADETHGGEFAMMMIDGVVV